MADIICTAHAFSDINTDRLGRPSVESFLT